MSYIPLFYIVLFQFLKFKADIYIGVDKSNLNNYCPVKEMSIPSIVFKSLLPGSLGNGVEYGFLKLVKTMRMFMTPEFKNAPPSFEGIKEKGLGMFNSDIIRMGETSSANGNCSARGSYNKYGRVAY